MANLWGLLHWQYQYDRMRAALHMAIAVNRGTDKPEEDEILEVHQLLFAATEGGLLAIDMALAEACAAHGFEAADARTFVGADVFVPLESGGSVSDSGTITEVKALLLGILTKVL